MKKLFKKWYFWVVAIILICSIGLFGGNSSTTPTDVAEDTTSAVADVKPSENSIDGYTCEILSAELGGKTYDGEPTIVITYEFTNNSDDAASFYTSFSDTVYQDGIECERTYTLDETNEDKSIKPGSTITVTLDYVLNDTTTDVDVELTGWISFDNTVISKTFKIAE